MVRDRGTLFGKERGNFMSRFFVENGAVAGNTIQITDPDDLRHIEKVLRLHPGDRVDVSDSTEFEYETEILSLESKTVTLRILDKQRFSREPELRVTLFQGVPKQGKMEEIIQKATELGVFAVVPLLTDRSIVDSLKNVEKKRERWQRIAAESVKQCRRGLIPQVEETVDLKAALKKFGDYDLVLFPYEDENKTTIKAALRSLCEKPKTAAIVIGPEGGFAKEEAEQILSAGGVSVTLGKTILRTETAGPAALAMAFYELEL